MSAARGIAAVLACCAACILADDQRAEAAAWLPPTELASGNLGWGAAAMTPQSDAIVAWRVFGGATQYKIQTSVRPAGGSFSPPENLIPFGSIVENLDIATDPAGNAVLTFRKSFGGSDLRLFYSYRPAGGSFGPAQEVTGAGIHVALPETAMDVNGNAITVFRRAPSGDDHIAYVFRPAGGEYGEQQQITAYAADTPKVEFAHDGTAIAAWEKGSAGGIVETARRSPGGSFGAIQTLSAEGAERPRLAVGPEGRALLAWSRYNGINSIVEASLAEPASPFGVPVQLSSPGADAGFAAAAVGSGNVAFVAWGEGDSFDLRASAAPPGGPLAAATPPGAANAFPIAAEYSQDGRLMLLWTAGETAPFVTTAAVRTPAGDFESTEPVSQSGESNTTEGLSGDGKGDFLALYSRDDGAGKYTLKARPYDGEPPRFVSLAVPQRAKTGKPASFSAGLSDTWSAISSVEWSFGDGRSATGDSVKHTYRRTGGRRTVKVTATDAAGNSRTEERTVVVKDVTPVVISGARFRPSTFAASGKSTAGASKAGRRSTLRYRLSERARVRVVFQRRLKGHRPKRAGLLKRSGKRGANRIKFSGKLGGRTLPPGRYRAMLVATDTGGLKSKPAFARFKIVGR